MTMETATPSTTPTETMDANDGDDESSATPKPHQQQQHQQQAQQQPLLSSPCSVAAIANLDSINDVNASTSYESFTHQELLSDTTTSNNSTNITLTNNNTKEQKQAAASLHDLIGLTHLDEPAILRALKLRYESDIIYTSTGPILIAVNPFQRMEGLYDGAVMEGYRRQGEGMIAVVVNNGGGGGGGSSCRSGRVSPSNGNDNNNNNDGNDDDDSSSSSNNNDNQKLPPHAYKTADDAYRAMKRGLENKVLMSSNTKTTSTASSSTTTTTAAGPMTNQSILVSGESGAGKTVTTKIVLNYFAMLSGQIKDATNSTNSNSNSNNNSNNNNSTSTVGIEHQVLQSNPLLEAFGNARTLRNDNSSRFGKYIDINFTSSGKLHGAKIDTYLLEKVRLLRPSRGERNYHIFYQFLEGATVEERSYLGLDGLSLYNFEILSCSSSSSSVSGGVSSKNGGGVVVDRRDGVVDGDMHKQMLDAMATIGFDSPTISAILRLVTAILHCGNVTFHVPHEKQQSFSDACSMDMTHSSLTVARLLGVKYEDFAEALTYRDIVAGKDEVIRTSLSKAESVKGCEALMKALYGALFDFIVDKVNESISNQHNGLNDAAKGLRGGKGDASAASIGVLDIFGFEIFDTNNFEQLCINYTNEALQQQFNKYVFKLEQEEYEREGIEWRFISFPDNQDVLDLIDRKHTGMLALLDEQCIVPSSTDAKLARYLYQRCDEHSRFVATSAQRVDFKFGIEHYAGNVEYSTDGWLEKNDDQLPVSSANLLRGSEFDLISKVQKFIHSEDRQGRGSIASPSVASQFSSQLSCLRSRIDATIPHYIRCLKPNDNMIPDSFDSDMIVDQLRCGGVLEAVRVSRAGYPTRYPHDVFVARYYVLGYGQQSRAKDNYNNAVVVTYSKGEDSSEVEQLVGKIAFSIWEDDQQKEEASSPEDISCETKNKSSYKNNISSNGITRPQTIEELSSLDFSSRCAVAGLQLGRTKVFLRREALDRIEALRAKKFGVSALAVQRVVRGIQARACYEILRHRMTRSAVKVQRAYRGYVRRLFLTPAAVKVQAVARGAIIRWRLSSPSKYTNNKRTWVPYKELEDVQADLEIIKAERDELLASNAAMQGEIESVVKQKQERLVSKISSMEASLLESKDKEERLGSAMKLMECSHTEALARLEDVKFNLINQNQHLSQQLECANERISSLNAELDDTKKSACKEQGELTSKISTLESDILESKQAACQEQVQLSKRINSLETDLLETKQTASLEQDQLNSKISSLETKLLESNVEEDRLDSAMKWMLSRHTEEKSNLINQNQHLSQQLESLNSRISSLNAELDDTKESACNEQRELTSKISTIESDLVELKQGACQEQEQLNAKIGSLKMDLLESKRVACQEQEQLSSKAVLANEHISSLTIELDGAKKLACKVQEELTSKISALQSDVLESKQAEKRLANLLATMEATHSDALRKMEKEKTATIEEMESLRKESNGRIIGLSTANAQCLTLSSGLDTAQKTAIQEQERLRSNISSLMVDLMNSKQNEDRQENVVARLKKEYEDYQATSQASLEEQMNAACESKMEPICLVEGKDRSFNEIMFMIQKECSDIIAKSKTMARELESSHGVILLSKDASSAYGLHEALDGFTNSMVEMAVDGQVKKLMISFCHHMIESASAEMSIEVSLL